MHDVAAAGSVVADALDFAHHQGVLHRDVEPQNILVLPRSYVLADFGLARAIDSGHSASLERFSYRHASPQVLDGDAPTVADDVYSLGSTLFTLLDGRAPFAAKDPNEDSALSYLRRARTSDPRPLERTDVPGELVTIVQRCLAKVPSDRFTSAGELRAALDAIPTESRAWAPGASPVSTPVPPPAIPTPEDAAFAPGARPVAVSALAELGTPRAPYRDDTDVTGLRPMEPQPPDPQLPRRWPIYGGIVAAALVAGVIVGFIRSDSDHSSGQAASPGPTLGSSGPSVAVPVPTIGGKTASVDKITTDKSLTPKITDVTRDNGAVIIRFRDASGGKATFVITGDDPGFVGTADPGAPGITIADQPAGERCYGIAAWVPQGDGFRRSPVVQACTAR